MLKNLGDSVTNSFSFGEVVFWPIITAIVVFIAKYVWIYVIQLSIKRAVKNKNNFQNFIKQVIDKEGIDSKLFNSDSLEYSKKNIIEYARFKNKVEKSELIWFDQILDWNANENIKIRQFFYYLTMNKNKKKKYTGA